MTERESLVRRTAEDLTVLADNAEKLRQLAGFYFKSGTFQNISNEFAAMVVLEAGRELGIKPIFALQTIYPIRNRLTMEAQLMRALFIDGGGEIEVIQQTTEVCELRLSKGDRKPQSYNYTIQEAAKAGLTKKDNWQNNPSDMLFARCSSRAIRRYDPGSILGMISREEAADGDIPLPEAPLPEVKVEVLVPKNGSSAPAAEPKVIEVKADAAPGPAEDKPKAAKKGTNKAPSAAKPEAPATPLPAPLENGLLDEKNVQNEAIQPEPETASDAAEPTLGEIIVSMCKTIEKDYGRADIFEKAAGALKTKFGLEATKDNLGTLAYTEEQAAFMVDALEKTIAVAAGKAKMGKK